jgi:hypothetical protein
MRRLRRVPPEQLRLALERRELVRAIMRGEVVAACLTPDPPPEPLTADERRHVAHCCANHGCAYSGDDCPVEALRARQRSACGAAEPCSREHGRPVRPRPRLPLNLKPPGPPPGDPRLVHLTGGARK